MHVFFKLTRNISIKKHLKESVVSLPHIDGPEITSSVNKFTLTTKDHLSAVDAYLKTKRLGGCLFGLRG